MVNELIEAKAFAPAHISGFFEPVYHPEDIFRTGSRGAGINLNIGATSKVTIEPATEQTINIFINNKKTTANVTNLALKYLLDKNKVKVTVNSKLDLPIAQGFGMSAAGALSSSLALSKLLGLSSDSALKAAHYAEVQLRTGLGDALASWFGGIEIRKTPGLPPWGLIEHIPGNFNLVLCIIDKKIDTSKILNDYYILSKINDYGKLCIKKILENPSIENLFVLSEYFSKKTGLAQEKTLKAIDIAKKYGKASMCMLGNSVFAFGETDKLCRALSSYGKIFLCNIDKDGAGFIKTK